MAVGMERKLWLSLALIILLSAGCAGTRQVAKRNIGYRVQVCFTESMEEAQYCHNRVEVDIKHKHYMVYTVYEAPYYKVRVGDFLQREDAYQLQTWLRNELGYSDAWVVRSRVVIN